jgi:hypothetical protein
MSSRLLDASGLLSQGLLPHRRTLFLFPSLCGAPAEWHRRGGQAVQLQCKTLQGFPAVSSPSAECVMRLRSVGLRNDPSVSEVFLHKSDLSEFCAARRRSDLTRL